jgi:uncharacterized protein YbaR (Trm112 family)
MRIWLLDILACPICKYYPLDLRILNWETDQKVFSRIESAFKGRELSILEENSMLTLPNGKKDKCVKTIEDGQIQIEDEFSREKKQLPDYLRILDVKAKSTQTISDVTESPATSLLEQVKSKVIDKVGKALKQIEAAGSKTSVDKEKKTLEDLLPEIYLLNWYFFLTEVDQALINCKKCQRWYPVIETIPHMLPDDLRNSDEDIAFLKKWSRKLPEKVLNEGKPFNMKTERPEKRKAKPH